MKLFKKKKEYNNNDLYRELRKLKSEHIKSCNKLEALDKNMYGGIYICSNDELEIQVNNNNHNCITITENGIKISSWPGTYVRQDIYDYISNNIKQILFISKEMRKISNMNMTDIIYYVKHFDYPKGE